MSKIIATAILFFGLFVGLTAPAEAQFSPYGQPQPCCLSSAWHDPYLMQQYQPMYLPPQQQIYTGRFQQYEPFYNPNQFGWNQGFYPAYGGQGFYGSYSSYPMWGNQNRNAISFGFAW